MTPIVLFKCSKCKLVRDTFEDAEKCERSHLAAISVRELEYRPGPYPLRVALAFPDGSVREYVADDIFYGRNGVGHAGHQNQKQE